MLGKLLWCMVAGRLKLTREWYNRHEFDFTVQFENNPQMHMINAILEKCLQETPEKCLPHARELLPVVDAHLNVIQRGGQMLREGVPRPCRVCGKGFYQALGGASTQALGLPIYVGLPGSQWRHEGALYALFFTCDYCGNIKLFKTR
jgi:hypothetical protein